jgi:choline kinase
MIYIIPMAGLGTRVRERGEYKPFVKVAGRRIIDWAHVGIEARQDVECIYHICTGEQNEKYGVSENLSNVITIESTTSQYETAIKGLQKIADKIKCRPVTFYNCDQLNIYQEYVYDYELLIPLYFERSGKSSYAQIQNGHVIGLHEKKRVSLHASSGVYVFKDASRLIEHPATECESIADYVNYFLSRFSAKGIPLTTHVKFDLGNMQSIREFEKVAHVFKKTTFSTNKKRNR